jgi:hypothetical protein
MMPAVHSVMQCLYFFKEIKVKVGFWSSFLLHGHHDLLFKEHCMEHYEAVDKLILFRR